MGDAGRQFRESGRAGASKDGFASIVDDRLSGFGVVVDAFRIETPLEEADLDVVLLVAGADDSILLTDSLDNVETKLTSMCSFTLIKRCFCRI